MFCSEKQFYFQCTKCLTLSTIKHILALNPGRWDGWVCTLSTKCKDTAVASTVNSLPRLSKFMSLFNSALCLSEVKQHRTGKHLLLRRDNRSRGFIKVKEMKINNAFLRIILQERLGGSKRRPTKCPQIHPCPSPNINPLLEY